MLTQPEESRVRIDFPDEEWIAIRIPIRNGDLRYAEDQASVGRSGKNGAVEVQFLPGTHKLALLERLIIAWSDSVPISRATIESLPEPIADRVLQEIDRQANRRPENQTAPLGNSSSKPSASAEDDGQESRLMEAGHPSSDT